MCFDLCNSPSADFDSTWRYDSRKFLNCVCQRCLDWGSDGVRSFPMRSFRSRCQHNFFAVLNDTAKNFLLCDLIESHGNKFLQCTSQWYLLKFSAIIVLSILHRSLYTRLLSAQLLLDVHQRLSRNLGAGLFWSNRLFWRVSIIRNKNREVQYSYLKDGAGNNKMIGNSNCDDSGAWCAFLIRIKPTRELLNQEQVVELRVPNIVYHYIDAEAESHYHAFQFLISIASQMSSTLRLGQILNGSKSCFTIVKQLQDSVWLGRSARTAHSESLAQRLTSLAEIRTRPQ